MEPLLVALAVPAVLAIALFFKTRRKPETLMPLEEVIRSADAMHQYGHDEQAIFLLQEYAHVYRDNIQLRDKIMQLEKNCQHQRKLHRQPSSRGPTRAL